VFNPFNILFGWLSHDIAIDLGTANTMVWVKGKGIAINEPSVVAVDIISKEPLAIGLDAKRMVGRTPANIVVIRPLRDGVISDFAATERMLRYFIDKVQRRYSAVNLPKPRVAIGIPSGATEVERRAVEEAAHNAGAREWYLVEEPKAAAIGAGLPVDEPIGNMVVDIGGGTTEVAVISLRGIAASTSIRVAGDEMNEAIVAYARQNYSLLIGERTAEEVKIEAGSAYPLDEEKESILRGRDLVTGLPKSVTISSVELREALSGCVDAIVDAVRSTIEVTPPELVADIMDRGIALTGGGALLKGLDRLLARETKFPVFVAEDPLSCVVRGASKVLELSNDERKKLLQTARRKPPRQ